MVSGRASNPTPMANLTSERRKLAQRPVATPSRKVSVRKVRNTIFKAGRDRLDLVLRSDLCTDQAALCLELLRCSLSGHVVDQFLRPAHCAWTDSRYFTRHCHCVGVGVIAKPSNQPKVERFRAREHSGSESEFLRDIGTNELAKLERSGHIRH